MVSVNKFKVKLDLEMRNLMEYSENGNIEYDYNLST